MNHSQTRLLALALTFASTTTAQNFVVAPSAHSSTDGASHRTLPGIAHTHRTQVVLGSNEVANLNGRTIIGLRFRRDARNPRALTNASARVVVRMGPAAFTSDDARPDFTANLPNPVEVYRGSITAPSSPALSGSATWDMQDTIRIALTTSYTHNGGPLAIEIEGLDAALADWPIDAASETAAGSLTLLGHTCGVMSGSPETASVASTGLVPGRSANFTLVAEAPSSAWLLLGNLRTAPIPLPNLPASGCELWVDPFTAIGAPIVAIDPTWSGFAIGAANAALTWPADPALSGANLGAQWVWLESIGLAVSNAMDCTLAGAPPALQAVELTSRNGEPPLLQHNAVPVIGFELQ
ncbi:MAG: hypothetical protein AB7I19_19495 [Planctomycetota bacterium]